ncbi:MAG: cyclic pyranopterin monophosphate synthase MoaC [Candidatus Asgardarchaeia archaeon]
MSEVRMVDVSKKAHSIRIAEAVGSIKLKRETISLIREGKLEKGDAISVAKVAGIMAAKRTWEILPLCHPIPIDHVKVDVVIKEDCVEVSSEVKSTSKTGVEMEALTATTVALLTLWDMVKKHEKDERGEYPWTRIEEIRVRKKEKIGLPRE